MTLPPLDDLVACPTCDTLHLMQDLPDGSIASCQRCHAVLVTTQASALARVFSLALTAFVLMIAAVSFPFLDLNVAGQHNATSVVGAILAFREGLALPLSVAVAFFIVILPFARLTAIIVATGPMIRAARPHRLAKPAFALAEALRPWAMAEIFMVGVAVALVKVAGLATIHIGPAFWAFAGLVIVTVLKDQMICRYAIWEALDTQPTA